VTKDNVSEEIQGPPLAPPNLSDVPDDAIEPEDSVVEVPGKGHHEAVVVEGVQQGYRWVEDE
jgi:hypothetical protein